jgi:hypothetical protein
MAEFASESQAKAAYNQFVSEFTSEPTEWKSLRDEGRELWFRVATAVLNRYTVDEL